MPLSAGGERDILGGVWQLSKTRFKEQPIHIEVGSGKAALPEMAKRHLN